MDRWFYADEGKTLGPLAFDDLLALLARRIDWENILVWRDGFSGWQAASNTAEISSRLRMPPPLPVRTPIIPDASAGAPKKRGAFYSLLSIGGLILAVAFGQMIGKPVGRELSNLVLGSSRSSDIEDVLTKTENELRPTLPRKLDNRTTLVGIGHVGRRLSYEHVVDLGNETPSPQDFISKAREVVISKVCNSSMKDSFKHGVTFEYVYSDRYRRPLGSIVIAGKDCNP